VSFDEETEALIRKLAARAGRTRAFHVPSRKGEAPKDLIAMMRQAFEWGFSMSSPREPAGDEILTRKRPIVLAIGEAGSCRRENADTLGGRRPAYTDHQGRAPPLASKARLEALSHGERERLCGPLSVKHFRGGQSNRVHPRTPGAHIRAAEERGQLPSRMRSTEFK